jgi:DNA-binding XRE family transcriptional regulator
MDPLAIARLFRQKREALGLTDYEIADLAGVPDNVYYDMENYANEAYRVATLGNLRRVINVLGIDISSIVELSGAEIISNSTQSLKEKKRNEQIAEARKKLCLSQDALADAIGFYVEAVNSMEGDPDFLEKWSLELIAKLSETLNISIYALLSN